MKILIVQAKHEEGVNQLEKYLEKANGIDMAFFPEGYLTGDGIVDKACELAEEYSVGIVSSFKKDGRERAFICDKSGKILMDKKKAEREFESPLIKPLNTECEGKNVGCIICMEILKGTRDFEMAEGKLDFIVHPIGVGMFSDEQFDLWIGEARAIAKKYNTKIMGASHLDGSYRNCGISIPIAYCIDENGEDLFVSKDDVRSRIVDLDKMTVEVLENMIY